MIHLIPVILICIAVSAGAGLIFGLFGGGSGIIMVPGYYYLLTHFQLAPSHYMQTAIATTAMASLILGSFSARVQLKAKHVDMAIVKKISIGLSVGAVVAVLLLNVIPSVFLKKLFGVVVALVAVWMWFYRQEKDLKQWSITGFINHVRTFFIGLLWFLVCVAVFTVPYLHKSGLNMRRAVGTATMIGAIFSGVAAVLLMTTGAFQIGATPMHIGYVNLLLLVVSLAPSSLAGHYGSKLSHRFPMHIMKKMYSGLVFLVAILMLI